MYELVVNTHMHTVYSDGQKTHREIANDAIAAGIDAIVVTDHNVLVSGLEDYYENDNKRVLLLIGEEIHNQAIQPQKNHLLAFGIEKELAPLAWDIEHLIKSIRKTGGLAFIAHPDDPAAPAFGETDITWDAWEIDGYNGIEIWNGMSEFKSLLKSRIHALFYAFNPHRITTSPFPETLRRWDELLTKGERIVAIGGSDAHAFPARMGFIRRILFPYEFHFQTINNHVFVNQAMTGDLYRDRNMILGAFAAGHNFIGYDLPASTRGFRFTAHGMQGKVTMGDQISSQNGVTLQIRLPRPVDCRLIRNGTIVQQWDNRDTCMYITTKAGAYRVEAYIEYLGKERGWIFSNPIYVI